MKLQCCICEKEIAEEAISMTLAKKSINKGHPTQQLYCHVECLESVLGKSVNLYIKHLE